MHENKPSEDTLSCSSRPFSSRLTEYRLTQPQRTGRRVHNHAKLLTTAATWQEGAQRSEECKICRRFFACRNQREIRRHNMRHMPQHGPPHARRKPIGTREFRSVHSMILSGRKRKIMLTASMMMNDESLWKTLYTVAAGFPDGTKSSQLSQERLRGYYTFFSSLHYTLPTAELRKYWKIATSTGNGELTWEGFSRLRSHKELLRWLFHVHDDVARMQGKTITESYANRYGRLLKGTGGGLSNFSVANPHMPLALGQLKRKISSRVRAMDDFLSTKFVSYSDFTHPRKTKLRKQYLDEAATYFWKLFTQDIASTNNAFSKRSVADRTAIILEAFDERYMLLHQRLYNKATRMPRDIVERLTT